MGSVEEQLRGYRKQKEAIAMIQSQLDFLEQPKIKISKITDEIFGGGTDIYTQYEKLMIKKDRLKIRITELELEVAAIEMALNLLSEVMPEEYKMLRMKYFFNKSNSYIADTLGYDKRTIIYKIQNGKDKFKQLLQEIEV